MEKTLNLQMTLKWVKDQSREEEPFVQVIKMEHLKGNFKKLRKRLIDN